MLSLIPPSIWCCIKHWSTLKKGVKRVTPRLLKVLIDSWHFWLHQGFELIDLKGEDGM